MGDYVPFTLEDIPKIVENVCPDNRYGIELLSDTVLALLAIDFCSDIETARELKKDLKTKRITHAEALSTILKSWIGSYAHNGGEAPFEEFVDALFSHGLNQFGASMMYRFFVDFSRPKATETVSVPIPSSLAQEQALANELVLEEIYKNLSFRDGRPEFQLVNKFWRDQGLRLWRMSEQVKIWKHKYKQDEEGFGVPMQEFLELWKKTGEDSNCWKLVKHPYRSYSVDLHHDGKEVREENHKVYEKEFWDMCGPLMEKLNLSGCFSRDSNTSKPIDVLKNVLLGFCPNLKELKMNNRYNQTEVETMIWKPREFPEGKFAEKLQSLILNRYYFKSEDFAKILQICPNLTSLVVTEGKHIRELLKPAVNGKLIELQRLTITAFVEYRYQAQGLALWQLLRSYVEKFPKALTHLDLGSINLDQSNSSLSNFCAAIGQCQTLQSLKLSFDRFFRPVSECNWFMDLSIFSFPNLVEFTVENRGFDYIYFDFGTLKRMPKLQKLNLNITPYQNPNNFQRRPGTEDWIYEGPRDLFAPDGVETNVYSEEEPIRCESLKKFCFQGWEINSEDISLISNWAPNLTYLDAIFTSDAIPLLLDSWGKLERLKIRSTGMIPLSCPRMLKDKKNNLKIAVNHYCTVSDRAGIGFEIKEFNGRLYYDYDWEDLD